MWFNNRNHNHYYFVLQVFPAQLSERLEMTE